MDRKLIGKKLVELRGKKTQAKVAESIGIAQSTYAMYESGLRIPNDEIKIKIALYYGKSVQEIFFNKILA